MSYDPSAQNQDANRALESDEFNIMVFSLEMGYKFCEFVEGKKLSRIKNKQKSLALVENSKSTPRFNI